MSFTTRSAVVSVLTTLGLFLVELPVEAQSDDADRPGKSFATDADNHLFSQLDKNGDNVLSSDEMSNAQRRFFDRLVRVGDADDDGKLSKSEYLSALKPPAPVASLGQPANRGRGRFDPAQTFRRLDSDGDGKLKLDELPQFLQTRFKPLFDRAGTEELTLEQYTRALRGGQQGARGLSADEFKEMDANGDGKLALSEVPTRRRGRFEPIFKRTDKKEISREELNRAMGASRRFGQTPAALAAMFSRFDANKDDRITLDEVPEPAKAYVRGLFRRLDKDVDKALTRDDFQKLSGAGARPNRD